MDFKIYSPVFKEGELIPSKYTCDGVNISPPLDWANPPKGTIEGMNDFRKNNYGGPCPPSGTHRYFFKLYSLDVSLQLKETTTKKQLLDAMKGHILAEAILIGRYKRL